MSIELKPIPGYRGKYSVTSDGRVFSHRQNKFLKPGQHVGGYQQVVLPNQRSIKISELVALAFIGPKPPNSNVDHINRIRNDDRVENLRYVKVWQNRANAKKMEIRKGRQTTSKFKGVYQSPRCNLRPWHAYITFGRKRIGLGYFRSETDAAMAYDAAALNLFGEFAVTNKDLGLL